MDTSTADVPVVFRLGPLEITSTVVTTWGIMVLLCGAAWLATRRLKVEPSGPQTALEGIVTAIEETIAEVAPDDARLLMPLIGSLWIYLFVTNLLGIIPGLASPTGDLAQTAALAIVVYLSVPWYGVQSQGLVGYLKHYLHPSPILLPFHLISEVFRTLALALRLFGNIMSLELAAALVLLVAGFLVPVPILMLHVVEALVQAYVFGMLALVYVAGGLKSSDTAPSQEE